MPHPAPGEEFLHHEGGELREKLHIGDYIVLYNTGSNGFFCWNGSSAQSYNEPFVYYDQDMDRPEGVVNHKNLQFEVTTINRYKTRRRYEKLKASLSGTEQLSPDQKLSLDTAQANALNEDRDNLMEMRRSMGRQVRFGEIVQLRHVQSGFYLHVDSNNLSNMIVCNLRACLRPSNGLTAQMIMRPQFRVKSDGDPVTFSDPIRLEPLKFRHHALCAYFPYGDMEENQDQVDGRRASVRLKRNVSNRMRGSLFTSTYGSETAMMNTRNTLERQFSTAHKNQLVFSDMHPLKLKFIKQSEASFTVDLSNRSSGFMMLLSRSYLTQQRFEAKSDGGMIHGLDYIRLFHTEMHGSLAAEGSINTQTEDVHLRLRPVDSGNIKTFMPTTNPNVFWQIELERAAHMSEPLQCTDLIRFRHATTGMYLSVSEEGCVELLQDPMNEAERASTVFCLRTALKGAQFVKNNLIAIIENVITGMRLKVLGDGDYVKRSQPQQMGPSMDTIRYDGALMKKVEAAKKVRSDNAFKLELVDQKAVAAFSKATGFADILFPMLEWIHQGYDFPTKEFTSFILFLEEMRDELLEDGGPCKLKQKMVRGLKVIDCILDSIEEIEKQKCSQEAGVKRLLSAINAVMYQIVYHYLLGRSSKNRFYIAKYFHLLHSVVHLRKDEGRSVMMAINQFVEDNRIIVDRITEDHINTFIELLQERKNYFYLIFLKSYCVCDGAAIQKNQQYIIKHWFEQTQEGLCLFRTGHSIGRIRNLLYISSDTGRTFIPMHVFVDRGSPFYNELSFKYLVQQLNLCVALCAERNLEGIHQITQKLELINWDSAFLCLRSDIMPSDIRAKFCEVITVMFIDVGMKFSIVEHTLTCFDYIKNTEEVEKVNEDFDSLPDAGTAASSSVDDLQLRESRNSNDSVEGNEEKIEDLMQWAHRFLLESQRMIQDNFADNLFLEQVMQLLSVLVKLGCYTDQDKCKELTNTILLVLDGTTDLPHAGIDMDHCSPAERLVLRLFRDKERFLVKFEHRFLMEAKMKGIDVLTMVMDQVKNQSLAEYIRLFIAAKHYRQEEENLRICTFLRILDEDFNPEHSDSKTVRQMGRMRQQILQMFDAVQVIEMERLQAVLLDLALYKSDAVVQKATAALCKYFFAKNSMFELAERAYFCSTQESRQLHEKLLKKVPNLRILINSQWAPANCHRMVRIFKYLSDKCLFKGQPHLLNQMIIYSHDAMDLVDSVLSRPHHTLHAWTETHHDSVFKSMVSFLTCWSRGNNVISQQVFQRMQFILSLPHNRASTVPLLISIFQQNTQFQEPMTEHDFKVIVDVAITSQRKLPEALHLLVNCSYCSRTGDLNLRNTFLIIKLLMESYSRVGGVAGASEAWLQALADQEHRDYHLAFVDLLACCCRTDRSFIESMCMKVFSLEDVLTCLVTVTEYDAKAVLVRFFDEVFVSAASDKLETRIDELQYNPMLWQLMQIWKQDIEQIIQELEELPQEKVCLIMKAQETKLISGSFNLMSDIEIKVNYLVDGILPLISSFLLRVFFPTAVNEPEAQRIFESFLVSMNRFVCLMSQYALNQKQMSAVTHWFERLEQMKEETLNKVSQWFETLLEMIELASDAAEVVGYFAEKHMIGEEEKLQLIEHYGDELSSFEDFLKFNERCKRIYEGRNTVQDQVYGVEHNSASYSQMGTIMELPLGQEFQFFIETFLDKNYSDVIMEDWPNRYRNLSVLVSQINSAGKITGLKGREKERQEELNVRCLQVLRGAIHNQVVKLPDDWGDRLRDSDVIFQLRHIRAIQIAISEHNPNEAVSSHLINPLSKSSKQIFAFLQVLLFNVSSIQQQDMIDYFESTRMEVFFYALDLLIKDLGVQIKKRKNATRKKEFHAARQVAEGDRKYELVARANDCLRIVRNSLLAKDMDQNFILFAKLEQHLTSLQDGSGECAMKILAQMCDGQFRPLQDYLRIQEDNYTSFNLISNLSGIVHQIYAGINEENIELLTAILDTLNEIAAGNHRNRLELVNNKMVDVLNVLLRTRELPGCDPEQALALRDIMAAVLLTLVEENGRMEAQLAREIMSTIDLPAMFRFMTQMWAMSKPNAEPNLQHLVELPRKRKPAATCIGRFASAMSNMKLCRYYRLHKVEEVKKEMLEVGFKYYLVLARFCDLDTKLLGRLEDPTGEYRKAYKCMQKLGESVEIVKDDCLHRVHFRVKNRRVIREEVKEMIKWEVDRQSEANKQRDFLTWIDSIIIEVGFMEQSLKNPIVYFLARLWFVWNWVPVFLSLAITVMSMVAFKPKWVIGQALPPNVTANPPPQLYDPVPEFVVDLRYEMLAVAITHSVICCLLFASFLVSNRPGFENIRSLYQAYRDRRKVAVNMPKKFEVKDEYTEVKRINLLEVNVIGPETLYYSAMLILSILGTFFGYFQAWGFYLFAFHLINIFTGNVILQNVLKAVQQAGITLISVLLLCMLALYIESIFCFAFFRYNTFADDNWYCETMFQCFISMMRQGLIFDKWIDFFMPKTEYLNTFNSLIATYIFSVACYIIVFIILLNIVTGVIVDKFAEVRQITEKKREDMLSSCFICSRKAFEFETKALGFFHHTTREHNMWAYLYYFIYLHKTKLNDLTALDLHVYRLWCEKRGDFFPLNRAMSLEDNVKNEEELKLNDMSRLVAWLQKMKHDQIEEHRKRKKVELQKLWKLQQMRKLRGEEDEDASVSIHGSRNSQSSV